jgi:prolipoprotein diacylglyceryltransferase
MPGAAASIPKTCSRPPSWAFWARWWVPLYYVLFNLDYYTQFPADHAVWEGGSPSTAAYRGHPGVAGVAYLRKLPVREYLDIAAPAWCGAGHRPWGDYFNEEAFGLHRAAWKL